MGLEYKALCIDRSHLGLEYKALCIVGRLWSLVYKCLSPARRLGSLGMQRSGLEQWFWCFVIQKAQAGGCPLPVFLLC